MWEKDPSTYASISSPTLYTRNYTVVKDIEGKKKQEPFYKLDNKNKITEGVQNYVGKTKKENCFDRFGKKRLRVFIETLFRYDLY